MLFIGFLRQTLRNAVTAACAVVAVIVALSPAGASAEEKAPSIAAVMATYGDVAAANFSDAANTARLLDQAIDSLLANPSSETLAAARMAWKTARPFYSQTEGFRFGNKIVDDVEGNLNSWPLDEGLIDYVDAPSYGDSKAENPLYTANIIATPSLRLGKKKLDARVIDKALIAQLNSALDVEANVGTGYHAIEFLLWGQDLNGTRPGAGNRPASDFDLKACTGGNCDRRRAYLKAASALLIDDLDSMVKAWQPDGDARKALAVQNENQQLAAILTGIGSLSYGELAGERMKLGVLLHDTEEEHDCFSDNTHNSHYFNQIGMMNIWNGRYGGNTTVSGASLAAYTRSQAPEAAKRVDAAMAITEAKLKAIKDKADSGEMAYDQMLAAGNDAGNKLILDGVDALVSQARAIESVVAALKLQAKFEGSDSLDNPAAISAN
ncbi:MAG: peptidase [Hyphomicrobium sp.]|nr:peptidase [Hyphomicrobium sp.]